MQSAGHSSQSFQMLEGRKLIWAEMAHKYAKDQKKKKGREKYAVNYGKAEVKNIIRSEMKKSADK